MSRMHSFTIHIEEQGLVNELPEMLLEDRMVDEAEKVDEHTIRCTTFDSNDEVRVSNYCKGYQRAVRRSYGTGERACAIREQAAHLLAQASLLQEAAKGIITNAVGIHNIYGHGSPDLTIAPIVKD